MFWSQASETSHCARPWISFLSSWRGPWTLQQTETMRMLCGETVSGYFICSKCTYLTMKQIKTASWFLCFKLQRWAGVFYAGRVSMSLWTIFVLSLCTSLGAMLSPATKMSLLLNTLHNVLDGCVHFGAHSDPPGSFVYKKLHIFIVKSTLRLIEYILIKISIFCSPSLMCLHQNSEDYASSLFYIWLFSHKCRCAALSCCTNCSKSSECFCVLLTAHTIPKGLEATALFHRKVFSPCQCF